MFNIEKKNYSKILRALWDQSLPTASGGQFFSTRKMHISEYACKTCLKGLGILLKCRETFERCLTECNSSKNTGLSQFHKFSDNCMLKTSVF